MRADALTIVLLAAVTSWPVAGQIRKAAVQCQPSGALARIDELPEGSGIAVSHRNAQRAWAHNDSGPPVLLALDNQGAVTGRLQITGAQVEDWEALAVGPCPTGSCLYIGDIGDNDAERENITLYRVPEPSDSGSSVAVGEVFQARYPDGGHDAEALLVSPMGDILIVTKGDTGPVALYRFPRGMKPGASVELQPVGNPRDSGEAGPNDRITDGAISPNGEWIALRTNHDLRFYSASDLLAGNWREAGRVDLEALKEPQGEGVAFADDTTIYLVGEGGGKSQPGTFARLTCTF